MDRGAHLSLADYGVLLSALALSGGIGAYYGFRAKKGQNDISNFLLGGRTLETFPVALSMMATILSAGTMVGVIGEVYLYGAQYILFPIGGAAGLALAAYSLIPVYRRINYISIYEYLERRYDRKLRMAYSFLYIFVFIIFVAVALYVPAMSLSTLDGIPQWISIVVSGVVCVGYCVVGGFRAVVWTDVLQTVLMIICMLTVIIKGTLDVGGVASVWRSSVKGGRIGELTVLESADTRYSIWSLFIGGAFILVNACCAGQAGVQRILSVRGEKEAIRATLLGAAITCIYMALLIVTGVVIYAYFSDCDPLSTSQIISHDQVFLYSISRMLRGYPGLQGLAIAGIFSGSLSSFSSYINSFAALTVEDFILPLMTKSKPTEERRLFLCKAMTVLYGAMGIILAFIVPYMGGIVQTCIFITGALGGPLMGVLLLGMFSRKSSTQSSIFGLLISLALCLWMAIGGWLYQTPKRHLPLEIDGCPINDSFYYNFLFNTTHVSEEQHTVFHLYSVSFMWYGPLGLVITIIFGTLASLVAGNKNEVDPRLLSPLVQKDVATLPLVDSSKRQDVARPIHLNGSKCFSKTATEETTNAESVLL